MTVVRRIRAYQRFSRAVLRFQQLRRQHEPLRIYGGLWCRLTYRPRRWSELDRVRS